MTTKTAFDRYVTDVGFDPTATPDAAAVSAWLDRELADESPSWVVSNLVDEMLFDNDRKQDKQEMVLRVVLDALTKPDPQAVVWYAMADAMKRLVQRDARRKAAAAAWVEEMLRPLKKSVEHYDAIGTDRRALARRQ